MQKKKKVLIIGGGFGGVSAAVHLAKKKHPNLSISLISDKLHFEYHPRLYRVVNGYSPLEVCIPLSQVFLNKPVEIIEDKIIQVDLAKRQLVGQTNQRYFFDYLVLALGSQTTFFGIEGLDKFAYGFKSIEEALTLKAHLHQVISQVKNQDALDQKAILARMVIVGAGASGVELAGELSDYCKKLANFHKIDPNLITVDLIEAAPRILPLVDEKMSKKIEKRLRSLGVNIFTNRAVVKEDITKVMLKDMSIGTQTLIWTAGIKPNNLFSQIKRLNFDKRGRVVVDSSLRAKGFDNVFVIGDGASTKYSGMAQTAIKDGEYVAERIAKEASTKYLPQKPYVSIPVGNRWAATQINSLVFYGKVGWWLRRLADLRYFLSILPMVKAIKAYEYGNRLTESCPICLKKKND